MGSLRRRLVVPAVGLAGFVAVVLVAPGLAVAPKPKPQPKPKPTFTWQVFARTGLPLGDISWTGKQFLYATETIGEVAVSGPSGSPVSPFAMLPMEVEEVRCRPSPGAHGWPAGYVYCHAPLGTIWRIASDGSTSVFATLPNTDPQDGTLAFDTAGGYGYAMLTSTGGPAGNGGTVYALGSDASIRTLGTYPGPGGADNIVFASAQFGSASNQLLIAVDTNPVPAGAPAGRVVAMAPDGTTRTLVSLPEGINPIAVIGRGDAPGGAAAPGVYLADTTSMNAYFLPAAQLKAWPGAVIVGTELTAHFWIVRPSAKGFAQLRVHGNLETTSSSWNLEGAASVA